MNKRLQYVCAVAAVVLAAGWSGRAAAQSRHQITISGTAFLVNGTPFPSVVLEFVAQRDRYRPVGR